MSPYLPGTPEYVTLGSDLVKPKRAEMVRKDSEDPGGVHGHTIRPCKLYSIHAGCKEPLILYPYSQSCGAVHRSECMVSTCVCSLR